MKESYVEGIASHSDPESCVHTCKGVGEALTGARTGRVLSRETACPRRELWIVRGAEAVGKSRRPHRRCRIGEAASAPARSETPSMCGNISHGNREIPRPSDRLQARRTERIEKPKGVRR